MTGQKTAILFSLKSAARGKVFDATGGRRTGIDSRVEVAERDNKLVAKTILW
jgi:hypothetical protein